MGFLRSSFLLVLLFWSGPLWVSAFSWEKVQVAEQNDKEPIAVTAHPRYGYLTFEANRSVLGRYGLTMDDLQKTMRTAIKGIQISPLTTDRDYDVVNISYRGELRGNVEKLQKLLVTTPMGTKVPIESLGAFKIYNK